MSDESVFSEHVRRQAEAWLETLSRRNVSSEDLAAFFAWRHDPQHRKAWLALEGPRERIERYVVRSQNERYRVVDIWTGETATIAMTPQDGLSEADAWHTARLLNRRADGGDRTVLQ